jgi:hypothetical protein
MPPNPNQGICVHCKYVDVKATGPNKYGCVFTRRGGTDWVLGEPWEERVDCYKVNTDGNCPFWEESEE